jgi:radical SAM family uncharacterized protein
VSAAPTNPSSTATARTSSVWAALEPHLPKVAKPARYIGLEDGAPASERAPHKVGWLLCYPDTYEIGLPNQGLQILREIVNERDDAYAERGYAVWSDLEAIMRRERIPFFSVETHTSAADFDAIAFNLSAELTYTNVLNCVDLAGVPVRSDERDETHPLVVVGGHCTYNPEPLADFVDVVVLGDGEEVIGDVTDVLREWRAEGKRPGSRPNVLRALARIEGVYVPSLYDVAYDGPFLAEVTPRFADVPERVEKRTISDLAAWPYPKQQLVPLTEVVHDRLNVEVFRGCTRGCRFCQAGMITRPVRERPAEQVRSMIDEGLKRTGYDEVTLTSLSTADFSGIEQTVDDVMNLDTGSAQPITLGLPSLRVDAFTVGLANKIQNARRTGLTFAPEAGTWRMRQVINKLIREEDLYGAVGSAYSQGWRRMKLYFLTGLPSETDEDTLGIAELAKHCVELGREHHKNPSVTVSVGGFVPKPFTPFQWFGQNTEDELRRKINLLKDTTRKMGGVQLKWHDPRASVIEGLLSRGDRRLGRVLELVWRRGGVFQEWGEHFDEKLWLDAMAECGLDPDWYIHRHRTEDEVLPWDHLSAGLHKDFLWMDWQDALAEVGLPDCRWTPCYDCGACTGYSIEHIVASATPPAGGSQGTGTPPVANQPEGLARPLGSLTSSAAPHSSVPVTLSPRRGPQ